GYTVSAPLVYKAQAGAKVTFCGPAVGRYIARFDKIRPHRGKGLPYCTAETIVLRQIISG
ncbi:MAG: hypothetical protein ACYSYM_06750, partial [Planctomycetota bacterium]